MALTKRQKEMEKNEATALKKNNNEVAAKEDLANIAALAAEADRKAVAEAKNKKIGKSKGIRGFPGGNED